MIITDSIIMQSETEVAVTHHPIPMCIPEIRGNEWKYVKECFDTNWVSSVGPFVNRFEREIADYLGASYTVAMCNGTAALHIALMVAEVQPEEEVLVPSLTFIAPVNTIKYIGASPVFIDAEPDYKQMDAAKVVDFLDKKCRWLNGGLFNKETSRRIKAIMPVHVHGHPVDMDPILEVAAKYELVVIEDATESLGSKYKRNFTGTLSHIACLSFNGNKIITTGGGGMIITENEEWARKAIYLSNQAKEDSVEYIHNEIGYNYRLTNVQAAIGCAQLQMIDEYIKDKRRIAEYYNEHLSGLQGIDTPGEAKSVFSNFWLYSILVKQNEYKMDNRSLMQKLTEEQIETKLLWHPIHSLPPYEKFQSYEIQVADELYNQALCLPCSVGITEEDQQRVVKSIRRISSS